MTRATRIAAILGVKDEIELILPAVQHLERMGVEEIVVYDGGSVDGTERVLADLAAQGRLRWRREQDCQLDGKTDLQIHLELIQGCSADWVMSIDADEFPLCSTGDLRTCPDLLDDAHDFITMPRRNVVLSAEGLAMALPPDPAALDGIQVVAEPVRNYWADAQVRADVPWLQSAVMPKMIGRREAIVHVTDGMHDFLGAGHSPGRRCRARHLFVAHVPFTRYDRFLTKVRNIDRLMQTHEAEFENQGFHWKRWREAWRSGELPAEFSRQQLDADRLQALQATGVVASAAAFLARLQHGDVPA